MDCVGFVHHTGQLREGTPDSAFSSGEERTVPYFSNVWSSPPRPGGVWGRPLLAARGAGRCGTLAWDGAGRSLSALGFFFFFDEVCQRSGERAERTERVGGGGDTTVTHSHEKKNKNQNNVVGTALAGIWGCLFYISHSPPPQIPPPAPTPPRPQAPTPPLPPTSPCIAFNFQPNQSQR